MRRGLKFNKNVDGEMAVDCLLRKDQHKRITQTIALCFQGESLHFGCNCSCLLFQKCLSFWEPFFCVCHREKLCYIDEDCCIYKGSGYTVC